VGNSASFEIGRLRYLVLHFFFSFVNCFLLFRDRAVAVLKRSPGAELLFSDNENKLFDFLAEDLEGKLQI
jgi:hypothetical protein